MFPVAAVPLRLLLQRQLKWISAVMLLPCSAAHVHALSARFAEQARILDRLDQETKVARVPY
jgi:hypothetical protein